MASRFSIPVHLQEMTTVTCRRAATVLSLLLVGGTACLVLLTIARLREVEQLRALAHEEQEIGLRFHRDGAAMILELHSAALRLGSDEATVGEKDQYAVLFARSESFFRHPPVPLGGAEAAFLQEVQKDVRIYGEQVQAWLDTPAAERLAGVAQADVPFRELLKDIQSLRDACGLRLTQRVNEMRDSMNDLRWLVTTASVVGPCLLGLLAWLAYRGWLMPLHQLAARADEAKSVREEMTSLGSLAAGLAHEIRNPIGALKNRAYALGLLVDAETAPKAAAQVGSMNRELDRVERIVGDFLIYARPADPQPTICRLAELVDSFHHDHQAELQQRGVRFELGVVDDAEFHADADMLRQALLNLVRNAADACAAQPDGRVRLEALAQEHRILLAVTDNGPGLPEDLQERLFKPFATLKRGGTGLGLTVSRSIARKHGGDLVMVPGQAEGARFEVRLPRV